MKITSRRITIPPALVVLAAVAALLSIGSCGRSNSGWVGRGGSIFAGDPPRATPTDDPTPVPDSTLSLEEQLARTPDADAEIELPPGTIRPEDRPGASRTRRRPGGPVPPRPAADSSMAGVAAAEVDSAGRQALAEAQARVDSLRAAGGEVPDSLAARLDSLQAAASPEIPILETIAAWEEGVERVSTWTPDQLPAEASYATPPELLRGSSFQPFGRSEQLAPAQDAFLLRMAEAQLARSAARRSPILTAAQRTKLDTTEFRPWIPDGSRLQVQDFVSHQITVDFDQDRVRFEHLYDGRVSVVPPLTLTMDEYLRRVSSGSQHRLWTEILREDLQRTERRQNQDRLLNLDIPVELPVGLQGIFGKGKPNLSVSGSETISFQGRSRWFPNQKQTETGRKQSKFPQLNMEQRLNLRLTGTIGDKVTVDVEQSSESETPLANRIKIRYTGYEDEIVQRVELGNTSLRLPGTKYVSFSGQAEGLFGINALAKVGDVDFNMILSKQEGRSDEKSVKLSAEVQTVRINDYDYVAGKYFFLRDPDGCPWTYTDVQVYLDDQIGGNNAEDGAIQAVATLAGAPPSEGDPRHEGQFNKLELFTDYSIQKAPYTGHPILVLAQPIRDANAVLAVRYAGRELEGPNLEEGTPFSVGTPIGEQGGTLYLALIRPERTNPTDLTSGPFGSLAKLELKNIYDLGANNILADGFEMRIRRKQYQGQSNEPDRLVDGTTFLAVMGVDRATLTSTGSTPGEDDVVDGAWVNYTEGTFIFPDLQPFNPTDSDLCLAVDCNFCRVDPGANGPYADRPLLWTTLDSTEFRAPEIYTRDRDVIANPEEVSKYYLEVTYRSPVSNIRLPAFNILEGSEVVTASGRRLQRDTHYRIDYALGEIEILPAAGVTETEDINVTYSHVPFGGGGGQKTLAGMAAFIRPEDAKWNLSSTWLFESKGGVPGLEGKRPRLGEEPSRTLVGELAGQYITDSWWLTDVTNRLPFLEAREASRFELEAGLGLSLPNPNTRNQLYIDDFEGAKDVISLSLSRRSWIFPSIPVRVLQETANSESLATARRGELLWYAPRRALQEFDLQPTLDAREGDDNRTMLELYLAPRGTTPEERSTSWVGFTQPLSRNGINLSTAQFLDIWINDGVPYERKDEREGTLYLEFGQVSEDAVWHQNDLFADPSTWTVVPPNGRLDTEDVSQDDVLDLSDQVDEDTGLDNVLATDPEDGFDDYDFEEVSGQDEGDYQPIQFRRINGTEGNQELDTEDINGDDNLDTFNAYFEIALDLADESLWETDVRRDFVLNDPGEPLSNVPADSSGWRRIRVSLANEELVTVKRDGSIEPIWEKIYQARLWTTGFSGERQRLQIAGIEIVGNRWLERPLADLRDRPLDEADIAPNEDFFVGVLNNKDDAAIYQPPFEPEKRTDDNTAEQEQSIALELRNFQPGHRAAAYRTYPRPQDFSSLYEDLEFYVNSRTVSGRADLRFSVRLSRDAAADTTNYYEYRMPVPDGWVLETVDLAELSQLQLLAPDSLTGRIEQDLGGGRSIVRKGQPSLNEIRQVAFAVENVGRTPLGEGSVWIDELRLDGVKKDVGTAARTIVDVKLSDFATLNANIERRGADFLSIGQDRGEGTTATSSNLRGAFNLDRFVSRAGVAIPLTLTETRNRRVPKFQPNKDLILENPTEEDISETIDRSVRISYTKRPSTAGWMRYLVDPFSLESEFRSRTDVAPTRRDSSLTRSGSVRWSLGLQDEGRIRLGDGPLGIFGGGELKLLPTLLSWGYSRSTSETDRYVRTDLDEEFTRSSTPDSRSTALALAAKAQPIRSVTYDLTSGRNLELDDEATLFGFGLGSETNRRQGVAANYDVPLLRETLGPRINWTSGSNLDFLIVGGARENEPERTNNFTNQNSTSISGRLDPRKLKDLFTGLPLVGGAPDSAGIARSRRPGGNSPISIDPLSLSYSFGKSSTLSRRVGSPTLLYQLGIDTAPGDEVTSLPSSSGTNNEQQSWTVDTNLKLPLGTTIRTAFRTSTTDGSRDGLSSRSSDRTWPDLDIGWGQLHSKLGLEKLLKLKSFSAKTSYKKTRRETQAGGDATKDITVERSLSPLLDVRATLENGIQATLTSSSIRSQRDRVDFNLSRNVTLTNRASLQLKKTLNLRRRVSIPGSSQTRMVTTRMDVSVGLDWSKSTQESIIAGQSNVQSGSSRWNVNTSTNYNFTDRISGTGRIGFEQASDIKNRANNQRAVDVQVSATFTF